MCNVVTKKHTALFYESEEEYLDVVIPFIKDGLKDNELVLWALPEFLRVEDTITHLDKSLENLDYFMKNEQLLIQDYETTYFIDGVFFSRGMLDRCRELEKKALEKGFNGVCVTGDGTWALNGYWWDFLTYESEVDSIVEDSKMRALCAYSRKDIEIKRVLDIGKNHRETVVRQNKVWNRLSPETYSP